MMKSQHVEKDAISSRIVSTRECPACSVVIQAIVPNMPTLVSLKGGFHVRHKPLD